jgi:hypothetical protein
MWRREPLQVVGELPAQLVQPGKLELLLRLHADGAQHAEPGGARRGVLEQLGLADPRLAEEYEGRASRTCGIDHPIEDRRFGNSGVQYRRAASPMTVCHRFASAHA